MSCDFLPSFLLGSCLSLTLIAIGLNPLPWRAIRPRTLTNGHPLSQKALQWVKTRLEICSGSHPICPPVMDRPFPKRILAFEKTSGGDIIVKVMNVGPGDKMGIYATLSHCWGVELPCVLTTDNLRSRQHGIPWMELPQTFQDAIQYCLELQISYLWVDALCIMQNDPEDWQDQSAKMADIYQNSYINLAATASDCGSSGCFPKTSRAYKERYLETPNTRGGYYQILIRQVISHWAVSPTLLSKSENPLLSRGWVFQERVLSPRVLHFCKHELVWECGQESLCECGSLPKTRNLKLQFALAARLRGVEGSAPSELLQLRSQLMDSSLWRSMASVSQASEHHSAEALAALRLADAMRVIMPQATDQWHGIVEQYSALELTKDKDRLPALSGLAERMSPFLGEYCAGLFRTSFVSDLCWRVEKLVPGLQRSAAYGGPSWSWVCTKAKVSFWTEGEITPRLTVPVPDPRDIRHRWATSILTSNAYGPWDTAWRHYGAAALNIISCTVDRNGKNTYGEVSSALLLVKGNLKASKIWVDTMEIADSFVPPSFEVELERGDETSHGVEMASGINMEVGIKMNPGVASWRFPFFPDYNLSSDGPYKISTSDIVFLLDISPNICLVLSRTSLKLSQDTFIFRRIGILKLPVELQVVYGIDVMRDSQRTRVAII